jgi:hypothetical protein
MPETLDSIPCPVCKYPVSVSSIGEQVQCPYCGTISQIAAEIPNTVIVGLSFFAAGVLLGPAVYQALQGLSAFLARQAHERIH